MIDHSIAGGFCFVKSENWMKRFMDEGDVVKRGTRDWLLAKKGFY